MRRCPKCNSYMSSNIKYIAGYPQVVYFCDCGHSSLKETFSYSDRTYVIKDNKVIHTDHIDEVIVYEN